MACHNLEPPIYETASPSIDVDSLVSPFLCYSLAMLQDAYTNTTTRGMQAHPLHPRNDASAQDTVILRDLNPYHGPRSREINLVDSSNGLICLVINTETLCFFNPATRVCREVICPKKCFEFYVNCLLAFGYSTPRDEYKLLYLNGESSLAVSKALLYLLRTNDDVRNWRELSVDDALRPYSFNFQIVGNIINEKAHWLVRKKRTYGSGHCFLAFDLTSETFNEISLPQLCGENQDIISTMFNDFPRGYFFMAGIEQKLCLCHEWKNFDIWMMIINHIDQNTEKIIAEDPALFSKTKIT
ncbi:F-box protein At3g07870-like [Silene latifolia]|uniref:F-box protein At3g07870-like n=1 Tax=Silene latifolia TaxID=37657 RepID=UPI003D77EDC0